MKILGIESSADETAAAVIEDGHRLLSNVVATSLDLHKFYGGIVPEIAARSHLEVVTPVIDRALRQAGCDWDDIDSIAVTQTPGLAGSLLIGVMTARMLAVTQRKPLFAINHVLGHIYASFIDESRQQDYHLPYKSPALPLLALIVSGGHSHLIYLKSHQDYEVIGRTLDDAVGEAFDKVAKMLGLPYPGGPSVDKAARRGNAEAVKLPVAKLDGYDFSFSGLKTAVLRAAQAKAGKDFTLASPELPGLLSESQKADLAASFQETALSTLLDRLAQAYENYRPASVVIGGGVAASSHLRELANQKLSKPPLYPDIKLCTDNAAMIAARAFFESQFRAADDPSAVDIDPTKSL